jgi:hypothetical protein
MGPTIQTSSGTYFDFIDPDSSEFTIEDIAHALAHICRFTGHVRTFYSVAQHCVLGSFLVPPEHARAFVLHDAAEAFLGDVSSPLKQLLPDYKGIEARVEAAVLKRFGLPPVLPLCIKAADLVMLATEKRDLMPRSDGPKWEVLQGYHPLPERIIPWGPEHAREMYLTRFYPHLIETPCRQGNPGGMQQRPH